MKEEWRDIPKYENRYQVSNKGRVRSLDAKVWGGKAFYIRKGQLLRPGIGSHGYYTVALNRYSHTIHSLVAMAFLPPRPERVHVDHINRNKLDNCVKNLRYASFSQNARNSKQCDRATSKYNGVVWFSRDKNWLAHMYIGKKMHHIGKFSDEKAAALAVNMFIKTNNLDRELNIV